MQNNFKGFGHLSLTVADLKRSLKLYRDIFGFEILMQRDKEVPGLGTLQVVSLGSPQGKMELVHPKREGSPAEAIPARGWHFSMEVRDLDAAISTLQDAGFAIDPSKIDTDLNWIGGRGVRSIHFSGPDGEHLELEQFI